MEKQLQELENVVKNLCTDRLEGERNTARNRMNEETEHDNEKELLSKSHERSQEPILSENTTESNNQHLSKTQKQSDLLTSNKDNVRQTKTATCVTSDSTDESGISPALHIQSSNRFNSNTLSSQMCQRSQCVGCYGHPDGIVLTSRTLIPFLSVDKNTCQYHRKMLDCMRNKKPMIIENPGSNSITRPLSKHTDELQSQTNIHKNVDPYKYSNTTVSNEIPPTPSVPQPRNVEQGYNLPNTENIPFPKFNPIYSQPISQQCYSTYMVPAQCQPTYYPTSQHYHSTQPQYYTTPTPTYYECCPTSSSLQSGYPILPQSTSQQLYPMQLQYQSTSVQYHPLQPQYYTTSPVTKETASCDNETMIDQTTCCNETVGQSSSHVNPVIIYEQRKATRSTVDNASIIPACSNNIIEPSHSSHVVEETTQITSDVEKIDQPTSEPLITTKQRVVPVDWLMSGNKSVCKQITQSIEDYTKQKATERSRIVESSREPSSVYESDRLSNTHTNIHSKQQNYTPLQDSTNIQKSLSVYDYATPVSDRKRWQPFTQPVDDGIKKLKVSIFTLVCILNLSIELCTVAMCKDLLSYCISCIIMYIEVCGTPWHSFYVIIELT